MFSIGHSVDLAMLFRVRAKIFIELDDLSSASNCIKEAMKKSHFMQILSQKPFGAIEESTLEVASDEATSVLNLVSSLLSKENVTTKILNNNCACFFYSGILYYWENEKFSFPP